MICEIEIWWLVRTSNPEVHTLDIDDKKLYYLFMKIHAQYITDEKGIKKAVILDLKEYEKLIHALEDLEDKKAFLAMSPWENFVDGVCNISV
jgi:hypothetical protein